MYSSNRTFSVECPVTIQQSKKGVHSIDIKRLPNESLLFVKVKEGGEKIWSFSKKQMLQCSRSRKGVLLLSVSS